MGNTFFGRCSHPLERSYHSSDVESFDWSPILRDASVLVQEQVKREREGVLQQAQEWLRQRLLQPVLLPNEGSPA